MRSEQFRAVFRSLRFRLTAWNTAVVLLTVLLALFGVHEGLRLSLTNEMDKSLLANTLEISLAVEQSFPDLEGPYKEMNRMVLGHAEEGLFAQLLAPDRQVLWSSDNTPALDGVPLPVANHPSLRGVPGYRLAQRRIQKGGVPGCTVRVGSSLKPVEEDVAKLTRLTTYAGVALLFLAPLGGYWLSGRATHPLARIITTAARLRPSHMEERLPIRGSGDELDKLSLTINRFLDLIADYLERNREFVANAAHELRSPLAAIQSSVDVTLNANRSVEEYEDLLGEIAGECGQLGVLINQLLLLAETDTARFVLDSHPVALDGLVERSVEMFRGAAEERGIQLIADCTRDTSVNGDGDRLRQVVNNLIDNSLKFTPRGGTVRVEVQPQLSSRQVVLRVADTGMGIDPIDLPHVFERFYRGDKSRQREQSVHGNGLGLSICKSIVLAHGGDIQVYSTPGKGATFAIRLPADGPFSAPIAEQPPLFSYTN
ncbi:MAG TPA: HAMP domain-containing sensor histidine kinase [Pirellulales bacterium]|jgi:signal transduction histidine kinase|nr:HAMP domain-containing sensor histidine kinase [Pirellulales bacterium]